MMRGLLLVPFAAGALACDQSGPLAGIEGTLIRSGSQSKLVISIEMIQRSVAASVAECDVEPVYHTPTHQQALISA